MFNITYLMRNKEQPSELLRTFVTTMIAMLVLFSCKEAEENDLDYREEMRAFVIDISMYAKETNNQFLIIPQNGQELITMNGEVDGELAYGYIAAIDGSGREDLFYGYHKIDEPTPNAEKEWMLSFCVLFEKNGVEVLATDYCSTPSIIDNSYQSSLAHQFISFAAPSRELDVIPTSPATPFNENSHDINNLHDASNFLYLINGSKFTSKASFIEAVNQSNYDVLIMDLFHNEDAFLMNEIELLKRKPNGDKRLVICYMSIGEAENYRYYWQTEWNKNPPSWLHKENPDWKGNYKVKYWHSAWKQIIMGTEIAYLDRIISAGFDGVYLDIIDAFEYFE
jgi:cysteinyl-tRNA synthetase, unknown class